MLASRKEFSIVVHAQHFPDSDTAMPIACYLMCVVAVAFWIGLLLHALFL